MRPAGGGERGSEHPHPTPRNQFNSNELKPLTVVSHHVLALFIIKGGQGVSESPVSNK